MDYQSRLQKLLLQIPKGKVTSYREIGKAMGTRGYHFIGQLLKHNPFPHEFPCYKVVCSDGSLGGYSLGADEKVRLLEADGIKVEDGGIVDFTARLHHF